ncbi:MAG: ATP-binding cassette domain-containing protein [Bdellovibrionaceae bacterium]|nr:ATP-binding cassette domain-containing protein [Pseudobdellovibrionaceae bacterium]
MSTVKNLYFSRDQFVLDIPFWEIPDTGISWLQGVSGSGKTTLLNILLGIEPVSNFQWWFGKKDLAKESIASRHIGVVFQELCLFPHMNSFENIQFAAQARGLSAQGENFDFLNQTFHLDSFLFKKVGLLSGGEAQRVALARALITRPKILFLDEAFSSLDVKLREESRKLVKICSQKWNIPVLMISHDQDDSKIAQQAFLLKEEKGGIRKILEV